MDTIDIMLELEARVRRDDGVSGTVDILSGLQLRIGMDGVGNTGW